MLAERRDVTIIGGGTTGLMLTKKLSELGMDVALIEKSPTFANGPSTRNEGWLHRGTYHANSTQDRKRAIQIAKRCIYGHEEIRRFAPEAVEDAELKSYAVIFKPERVNEATSRWDEAGVFYKPVAPSEYEKAVPESKIPTTAQAFEVGDVGIDTRMLYQKLLATGVRAGAKVFQDATATFKDPNIAIVTQPGQSDVLIESGLVLHTTGHAMKQYFADNFRVELPMRYWKSHLLLMDRLSRSSVFAIDAGEAGMMNHGEYSIVGANEDAFTVDSPTYDTIDLGVENARNAVRRLYPLDRSVRDFPIACIKVDMPNQIDEARSLNISVSEPVKGHLAVLPGKMTESPYVTDAVTKIVYNRLSPTNITQRPIDTWVAA
jgi:glycine/D-amino acid oxidase-like deaminating enzyme